MVRESWVAKRSLALKAGAAARSRLISAGLGSSRLISANIFALKAGRLPPPPPPPKLTRSTPSKRRAAPEAAGGGEKRAKRARGPSAAAAARMERALSERLYLVERRDASSSSPSGMVRACGSSSYAQPSVGAPTAVF